MSQVQLDRFATRRKQLQHGLSSHQAILVLANQPDIHYLTGFPFLVPEEREAILLISPTQVFLHHAHFTPTVAQPGVTLVADYHPASLAKSLQSCLKVDSPTTIWLDENHLTFREGTDIRANLNQPSVTWAAWPETDLADLRSLKDPLEIATLRQAGQIASQVASQVVTWLEPGLTEQALAQRIDLAMAEAGSDRPAFPTIVAFGAHAAAPHHQPGLTKLTRETGVLIDFGARVAGYRSDMTRSWWFGTQPSQEFLAVQSSVQAAYQAGISWLNQQLAQGQPATAAGLDEVVRDVITTAGYGPQFIHTSGHGVGLDIHEPPSIFRTNPTQLQPTMVITLEPGIYVPNQLGYRFENTLLIEPKQVVELT